MRRSRGIDSESDRFSQSVIDVTPPLAVINEDEHVTKISRLVPSYYSNSPSLKFPIILNYDASLDNLMVILLDTTFTDVFL